MLTLAQEIVKKQFLSNFNFHNSITNVISLAGNVFGVRCASKKAGGSTRNRKGHARPKHRRIYYSDGASVQKGMILVRQNKLRFHPGLNVGFGSNATLFAMEAGKVLVTCEKIDPNMNRSWVSNHYSGRDISRIYKKFFHVIPEKQHTVFREVDPKSN